MNYFYLFILLLQKGLKNVFDEAILAALEPPEPIKKRKCAILQSCGQINRCDNYVIKIFKIKKLNHDLAWIQ